MAEACLRGRKPKHDRLRTAAPRVDAADDVKDPHDALRMPQAARLEARSGAPAAPPAAARRSDDRILGRAGQRALGHGAPLVGRRRQRLDRSDDCVGVARGHDEAVALMSRYAAGVLGDDDRQACGERLVDGRRRALAERRQQKDVTPGVLRGHGGAWHGAGHLNEALDLGAHRVGDVDGSDHAEDGPGAQALGGVQNVGRPLAQADFADGQDPQRPRSAIAAAVFASAVDPVWDHDAFLQGTAASADAVADELGRANDEIGERPLGALPRGEPPGVRIGRRRELPVRETRLLARDKVVEKLAWGVHLFNGGPQPGSTGRRQLLRAVACERVKAGRIAESAARDEFGKPAPAQTA